MNPTPIREERPEIDLFSWSKKEAARVAAMKDLNRKVMDALEDALAARDGTRQAKAVEMANDALKAKRKEILDGDSEFVDLRGKVKSLKKKLKETPEAAKAAALTDEVAGREKEIGAVQGKISDVLAGRDRPIDDVFPGAEVARDEHGNLRITVTDDQIPNARKDREGGRRRDLE